MAQLLKDWRKISDSIFPIAKPETPPHKTKQSPHGDRDKWMVSNFKNIFKGIEFRTFH